MTDDAFHGLVLGVIRKRYRRVILDGYLVSRPFTKEAL
jgi:hypothetical protein